MAGSTYINRSASSSVTSDKIFTMSWWFKGRLTDTQQDFFMHESGSPHSQKLHLHITNANIFRMGWYNGSQEYNLDTAMRFRDPNAWYHMVFRYDTTQATASDRVRIYVNGVLQELTAIGGGSPSSQYPSQNITMDLGTKNIEYGAYVAASTTVYSDYVLSHVYYCDGQSYGADTFGETDSVTGEWRIKDSVSVTYGSNGHYLFKNNDGVTDQSGNGNNFTVAAGTLMSTNDCPNDVFTTLNPLNYTSSAVTYSIGNTKGTYPGSWIASLGTLGAMKGKYYWEAKVVSGNNGNMMFGIAREGVNLDSTPYTQTGVICSVLGGDQYVDGTYNAGAGDAVVNGNIIGIALDLDSATKTVKFYKNGAIYSSSGTINLSSVNYDDKFVFPFFGGNSSSANAKWECNFGNGYFSTTAISSEGTNASGIGEFEYDVPTGYTALSTKGLNL